MRAPGSPGSVFAEFQTAYDRTIAQDEIQGALKRGE